MTVYEYASDMNKSVKEILDLCKKLNIAADSEDYELSDEDALNKLEKLGITFVNKDLVNGEWVEADDRNKRKKRKKQKEELDVKGKAIVTRKTKVKPGYKKKKQFELEAHKKRQRRIEAKARKKK